MLKKSVSLIVNTELLLGKRIAGGTVRNEKYHRAMHMYIHT